MLSAATKADQLLTHTRKRRDTKWKTEVAEPHRVLYAAAVQRHTNMAVIQNSRKTLPCIIERLAGWHMSSGTLCADMRTSYNKWRERQVCDAGTEATLTHFFWSSETADIFRGRNYLTVHCTCR